MDIDGTELDRAVDSMDAPSSRLLPIVLDVTARSAWASVVERVNRALGEVGVLVNNAGISTVSSQRQVVALLATASHKGLTAREIADQTELTQFNVYEKLDRLGELGYAEEVPDSNPKRWHLTPRARRLAHDGMRLRIAPSVSSASADEIREAISWCVETTGEHATFTAAMESRKNALASWAKEDYPGLKTWNGPQPPSKPEIFTPASRPGRSPWR